MPHLSSLSLDFLGFQAHLVFTDIHGTRSSSKEPSDHVGRNSGNSRCAGWNPLKQRREKWSCACRIQSKVAMASICFKQLGQSNQCCSSFCGCANVSKSWSYTSSLFRIVRSGYWKWSCLYIPFWVLAPSLF